MIRGLWHRETVALLLLMALMPLALAWLWFGGVVAGQRLALALLISGGWHLVFMLARAQPPSFAGAVTALAVAMLAPEGLGLAELVLGVSFGTVIAELAFGGWGRNVLNPATATLAFLGFCFPAAPWPEFEVPMTWAIPPALIMGACAGVMPARVIAGAAIPLAMAHAAGLTVAPLIPATGLVLALLVTDPVTSASTRLGGWLYGAAFGGLVALFAAGWSGAEPVRVSVSAALLASLAAPLIDEISIALWLWRRRRHHG